MAKKKAAPKPKPASGKPKTKRSKAEDDETVMLFIPQTLYERYVRLGEAGGQKALRDLFQMQTEGDDRRYNMVHCEVDSIDNLPPRAKDPAAKDDDDRDPIKLCDEGGR